MKKEQSKMLGAVKLLKLLSHPVRLSILCNLLHEGEMSVSALVAAEGGKAGQSQVSQFLGKMRREGLLSSRKEAQTVYYKIKSAEAEAIIHTLYKLYCGL